MRQLTFSPEFDLVSPDGKITEIHMRQNEHTDVTVTIEEISPYFKGFSLDKELIEFNGKSTLAQLGVNAHLLSVELSSSKRRANVYVQLTPYCSLGQKLLAHLTTGAYIGKLFAKDPHRRVRNPDYLLRMFGRTDRDGLPLLSLGGHDHIKLEKIDGHTIAFLDALDGVIEYDEEMHAFVPTLAKALTNPKIKTRELLYLNQKWIPGAPKKSPDGSLLLLRTVPLHIRTAFGRVVDEFLPKGVLHTTANLLQPDTKASGDVYEFFGKTDEEIFQIPIEFYTLEPQREHVFFSDRDQLQSSLENEESLFKAFKTAPGTDKDCSIFVVKGEQMLKLTSNDWIEQSRATQPLPTLFDLPRQAQMVQETIQQQSAYPFLKGIEQGNITSQGVLFSRYFPSPLMKKMLLGDMVQSSLKGIYFQIPSFAHGDFFSHEDRSMLLDLAKFAIPVYWVDKRCGKVLQFAPKPEKDTGMFVPLEKYEHFVHATAFGVYGSYILTKQFEEELESLLLGVLKLQQRTHHKLLSKDTPLALITGGGPGLMEQSNQIARKLGILSCANIVDFSESQTKEQLQNPYIDAKMTYRIDRLVERQAEFNLDFPIFLTGGYGTDFELALECVRRKVIVNEPTPILLFGTPTYWEKKITSAYKANLELGTIAGSEWVSNCFYSVETGEQGLRIYEKYFMGELPIGRDHPPSPQGFISKVP